MTIEDVLKLNIPDEFGVNDDGSGYAYDSVCDQISTIDHDTYYDCGATKFVIFLNDAQVVKIPFNGMFYYNDDPEYDFEGDVFHEFNTEDYCAVEAAIYQDAIVEGLDKFFAGTTLVGFSENNKTPIYVSERVFAFHDRGNTSSSNPSQDSINKAKEYHSGIHSIWLASALEYYGEEEVCRLIDFIKNEGVGDFHGGNVGYRADGSPCLLDYSGYNEN